MRRTRHLKVLVAALTRNRPHMLESLMASWADMVHPVNCSVTFVIVENDIAANCAGIVAARARDLNIDIQYVHEPQAGIPCARNRAAKYAVETDADLLAFIDDDEMATTDWLECLVAGYRSSDAVLLGGPVSAVQPDVELSKWQTLMFANVAARFENIAERAAERMASSTPNCVTIVTNNWLGEVSLFSDHNIWFNIQDKLTGGEDTEFFADVRAKDLPTAWVADAYVEEVIPKERLSFAYQYRRGRDQSAAHSARKIRTDPTHVVFLALTVPARILLTAASALAVPFIAKRGLIIFARSLGTLVGTTATLFGYRSKAYQKIQGY